MNSTMYIKLNNCHLSQKKKEYISSIAQQANNPKVCQYLRDYFPSPYTEKDALEWVTFNQVDPVLKNLAIVVDGQCVGSIGIVLETDIHRSNAEIGYWLGEAYWGQGIITEAVRHMVQYTFDNFDIFRIYAGVIDGNLGSEKVLQKAGFSLEYTVKKGVIKNGKLLDEHIYAIRNC